MTNMNIVAIKQMLKTLRQFKESEILHDYQDFSLRYCGLTDTFILVHSSTHQVEEYQDLDKCANVIEKLVQGSCNVVK